MCAENAVNFILFISPDEGGSHKTIKYFEAQYGIQTSDVRWSTLSNMSQTGKGAKIMENFLMKINIKLGGLCYTIELESNELTAKWLNSDNMFVGLDVNHPPPLSKVQEKRGEHMKEPSVIGICANTGVHAFDFTGGYDFQETRSEAVIVKLKEMMVEMLRRYQSNHGGKLPKVIVFFRDGVSEGQFKMVLQREVPQIRQACIETGGGINHGVSLTVLVVQKRHNTRLFPSNIYPSSRATEQNIPAGTVVDKVIVHPNQTEFYLNSHRTIQGTARTPKYVTLVDDSNFTQDDLQGISYALAYGHQIINQSVSLPAPVFGAHELAKRGKDNFRVHVTRDMSTSASTASSGGIAEPDWVEASEKLKITTTGLTSTKFWA